MSAPSVADRFYDALAQGDLAGLRACLAPGAIVWHSFDRVEQDVEATIASLEGLIANSSERSSQNVQQEPIKGGLLRRHLFVLGLANGKRLAWPVCLVFQIENELIVRMDEYIDRQGSFTIE